MKPQPMSTVSFAQPDITLHLDMGGVIRRASLSGTIEEESVEDWLGRPWADTVAVGGKSVQRMVDDALRSGVSAFRQIAQRFPSGRELPIEYTTVRLGGTDGLLVIGKNLLAVAGVEARLVETQQALERDHWKRRELEGPDRHPAAPAGEVVLHVRAKDLQIIGANPAAQGALGSAVGGGELLQRLVPRERKALQTMLQRLAEHGKAPGILVHLGHGSRPWLIRAPQAVEGDGVFQLQLAPGMGAVPEQAPQPPIATLIERLPDGFVVVDQEGTIIHANHAFLDLIQLPTIGLVLGERLVRWLDRPGSDVAQLLASVNRRGVMRLFSTVLHSDLGTETEVELSAVGDSVERPRFIGIVLRDVGRRLSRVEEVAAGGLEATLGSLTCQVGKTPLLDLVKNTVEVVERHYVAAALELTRGNRTAAAEVLGLSRQSLYAKLGRYGLDGSQA
jgi:transcriptional regulator PpsR